MIIMKTLLMKKIYGLISIIYLNHLKFFSFGFLFSPLSPRLLIPMGYSFISISYSESIQYYRWGQNGNAFSVILVSNFWSTFWNYFWYPFSIPFLHPVLFGFWYPFLHRFWYPFWSPFW